MFLVFLSRLRPRLTSKFANSANMIQEIFKIFKNAIWVLKNAEFDADLE
jgi:hypothetical protein